MYAKKKVMIFEFLLDRTITNSFGKACYRMAFASQINKKNNNNDQCPSTFHLQLHLQININSYQLHM